MYVKIKEIEEIKARLFRIENRNNKNKKIQNVCCPINQTMKNVAIVGAIL